MTEHEKISLASQTITYLCKHALTQKNAQEVASLVLSDKGMEMLKWNSAFLKLDE